MPEKFAIIDGTYYIFRAFFGLRQNLTNPQGMPTNAIYGFKRMLIYLLNQFNPKYLAIVFDSGKPSFRNSIFTEYKANRDAMPQELAEQIPYVQKLVTKLGYKKIIMEGYEADDVLGSLAKKFKNSADVCLISADKDLTQLIDERIRMYDSMRNIDMGVAEVQKKYKVLPEAIPDYLALVGDTSDNIPGAAGIGPVGAAKLLNRFKNIADIEKNLSQITGKEGDKLRASWDNIIMSLKLTKIKIDLPLTDIKIDDFLPQRIDFTDLKSFYDEIGFREDEFFKSHNASAQPTTIDAAKNNQLSFIEETKDKPKESLPSVKENITNDLIDRSKYELITDKDSLLRYLQKAKKNNLLCLDLETSSLNTLDAKIVGVALKTDHLPAAYAPILHDGLDKQLALDDFLTEIKDILSNQKFVLIGQHLKYDLSVLQNHQIITNAKLEDTLLQAYLLHPGRSSYSLDNLAKNFLSHTPIKYEELVGKKGKDQKNFAEVDVNLAKEYAAEDADVTYHLYKIFAGEMANSKLKKIYYDIEIPLTKLLMKMELTGVKVNASHLQDYSSILKQDLTKLEKEIYLLAKEEFNINSPKQLSHILFQKLGIQEHKKPTKTGFSTAQIVLERLTRKYPIAQAIISYRLKTKLINTYLDVLPKLIHPKTGRVHSHYSQTIVATGRLSSSNPNLQNIPIRGQERSHIRKAFITNKNWLLLSADYSQIELRVLAHLSQDAGLIKAFNEKIDIHSQSATKIFEINLTEVTPEQRAIAKAINFGLIYGMGPLRLADEVNVSIKEASDFIKSYFAQYPKIKDYMKQCIAFATEHEYIETHFYRKRYLPYISSKNRKERGAAQRIAMNTPIQGTAADIIKIAMINLDHKLADYYKNKPNQAAIIMQIHDELVLEVYKDDLDIVKKMVKDVMENSTKLLVPLEVQMGYGENWAKAQH